MAERRMFAKSIIDSDVFLDMPLSTQALYFHLSMRADDEGFISNPKKIMRMIGASQNELELLLAKRYLLSFESGIVVIKHWRIHNYIQKDRFKPTLFREEKELLAIKENKSYTDKMDTDCIHDGYAGKVSIGKEREGKSNIKEEPTGSDFIGITQSHWNSKNNLPACTLTMASFTEGGKMATRIRDFGLDYVTRAIDKLSEAWDSIEYKYRPKSYQRFILGNVEYWANYEKPQEEKSNFQKMLDEMED
jgi:hypothetical protein